MDKTDLTRKELLSALANEDVIVNANGELIKLIEDALHYSLDDGKTWKKSTNQFFVEPSDFRIMRQEESSQRVLSTILEIIDTIKVRFKYMANDYAYGRIMVSKDLDVNCPISYLPIDFDYSDLVELFMKLEDRYALDRLKEGHYFHLGMSLKEIADNLEVILNRRIKS